MTRTENVSQSVTSEVEQPSSEMMGSCPIAFLGGVIGLLVVALLGLAIGLTACNLLCVGEMQVTETAS